ncbi:MAG TPA: electron transfer flavoprotein subunit beta/FixA family protein [Pseudomonadota bacterium]|nr:electron transfer flavoprotein subunit beta/FixA family protein [Pseudomonadota bacterium]HNO67697.1 electron transfer flavoprotein subunit beta/FixA family protein [Pseudomonadota bacterium]
MKILVTAKRIPDPTQKLKLKDNALDLSGANWQLNQFDEYAVEAALRLTEDGANQAVRQGQVTVASLGPADVATQLRSALAMGADKAIRIEAKDEELDASVVAKALAKIVQRDQPDLVLMGKLAADNEGNDVGQRLAAILGWPQATFACSIQVTDGGKAVIVGREVDAGVELKKVRLPAVVTVDLRIVSPHAVKNGRTAPTFAYAEGPRYATLKGIRAAKDKPLEQLQLAQLGVAPGAKTKVLKVEMPPARQAGKKVGSVAELVEKLNKEAKVI